MAANIEIPELYKPSSVVQDMRGKNQDLSLTEILFTLRNSVGGGREIPTQFDMPPWRVPKDLCPKAGIINEILSNSMKIQSSRIPKSGDFEEFILSNSSMAVCGLLKFYLAQILNEDVISIVFGVLLWDPNARQGVNDYEGTPYLWMEIAGQPIDNTYVEIPNSETNLEYFYKSKQIISYAKEDPFKTKLRLYLGQEDGLPETVKHNFKIFREYGNDVHIEKFVIFAFECSDLNPCVRMYDILMREYFKNHYQVEINSLEHKWERQCWNCFKVWEDPSLLKTCVKCKRAKYCGQSCQQSEWKMHKLLHKELELAREILTKDEDDN
ncbi:uncharacterized protein LOC131883151 isoform X1 [Tigriopus californicus]|uniref:uncharacterized protein LOC131883151 isoform X1 n=2 Tax=Tigriopus californicus TaxID=6832 RepID=UPI0027DAAD5E|nr:uncharacterized protein LOC131883151 isoform X1 [Tigriopus californicus]